MATILLSIGSITTLVQNVVYALPAQSCVVNTTLACETSIDGTNWSPYVSGMVTSAKFLRCTTGTPTVTVSKAVASGGGTLPTDTVGKALISQGAGVNPIFSKDVVLSGVGSGQVALVNESLGANNRRYAINANSGALRFTPQTDAGLDVGNVTTIDRNGQINCTIIQADIAVGNLRLAIGAGNALFRMTPRTVATVTGMQAGDLCNFSDSSSNTPGASLAGGGSFSVLARYNGTNWIVII